jgi:hypothetical protein
LAAYRLSKTGSFGREALLRIYAETCTCSKGFGALLDAGRKFITGSLAIVGQRGPEAV